MDLLKGDDLIYKEESYKIIGASMDVYNSLGCGFLEAVYQEALEIEFSLRGIPFEREVRIRIDYKGHTLRKEYVADFICYNKIVVEIKALSLIKSENLAQTLNYLKATTNKLGLLINFGESSLKYRRVVL